MQHLKFDILDKGFIRVVDVMGDDNSVVQAARVSYGDGTKQVSEDRGLIRYLMRHRHTTPFEMCEIKFHIKAPLFVVAQWMRHRMSSTNMLSYRYSEAKDEFYIPEMWRAQSQTNKQGGEEEAILSNKIRYEIDQALHDSVLGYHNLLNAGVSREMARMVLPQNLYTEFYWKIDLHNLLHFLKLRMDAHAQWEIRQYANAMAEIVQNWVPICWEAFEDYVLKAVTFSKQEMEILQLLLKGCDPFSGSANLVYDSLEQLSKREREEFQQKTGW